MKLPSALLSVARLAPAPIDLPPVVVYPQVSAGGGFGRRWLVPERAVGTMSVVVRSPLLDQDRRFFQRIEDLHVQQFVSELAVETFALSQRTPLVRVSGRSVLQGAAWLDEQRADIQPF